MSAFTIGGSDAASAAGVHPYLSAVELWALKTGRMARPESEAMSWGKRLEPLVLAEVENRGHEVVPSPSDGFADPEFSWMVGHPDAFTAVEGERAVLEVKTANSFAWPKGDVPIQTQAQCQWYMMLTGCRRALVAALVNGQRLEVHELRRDDSALALLRLLAAEFYEHLRRDKPPAPDGSESARDALRELFPGAASEKVYRLTRDEAKVYRKLVGLNQTIAAATEQKRECENLLKLAAGDAEKAITPQDTDAFTWRNRVTSRVDTKALREARPEVAEEFTIHKTERVFKLL